MSFPTLPIVLPIKGTNANDLLQGGRGEDIIYGYRGDDTILAYGGDDAIFAGRGNDYVEGGSGNDTINGGQGDDYIIAGGDYDYGPILSTSFPIYPYQLDDDSVSGGAGNDTIIGNGGNDTLSGDDGNDYIVGDSFEFSFNGADSKVIFDNPVGGGIILYPLPFPQSNDDLLRGGQGSDTILGGSGNDTLQGGQDADHLYGGSGDDVVRGGQGNDIISGGQDNGTVHFQYELPPQYIALELGRKGIGLPIPYDPPIAITGGDTLTGGAGADTFVYGLGDGVDFITDFNLGQGDHLSIGEGLTPVVLDLGDGNTTIFFLPSADPSQDFPSGYVPDYLADSAIVLIGVHYTYDDLFGN